MGKIRFGLHAGGAKVGSINGENWRAWNWNITDHTGTEVARILSDPARLRAMGMIGAQVVERERGAVGRIIEATEQVMNTGPQPPAERAAVAGGLGNS